MIKVKDLHHVSIVVEDVATSKHFYCDILGLVDVPRSPTFTFDGAWFRKSGVEVHLIQINEAVQPPGDGPNDPTEIRDLTFARHFCFSVEDMDEAVSTLNKNNIPIAMGPRQRGDGAIQLYIYDPDGHMVELVYEPWV
jgi:catechol 2,3-dioxygenase-like lactoylglutathione lyase family enzyme